MKFFNRGGKDRPITPKTIRDVSDDEIESAVSIADEDDLEQFAREKSQLERNIDESMTYFRGGEDNLGDVWRDIDLNKRIEILKKYAYPDRDDEYIRTMAMFRWEGLSEDAKRGIVQYVYDNT